MTTHASTLPDPALQYTNTTGKILSHGFVVTPHALNGRALGHGVYLAPLEHAALSFTYATGRHNYRRGFRVCVCVCVWIEGRCMSSFLHPSKCRRCSIYASNPPHTADAPGHMLLCKLYVSKYEQLAEVGRYPPSLPLSDSSRPRICCWNPIPSQPIDRLTNPQGNQFQAKDPTSEAIQSHDKIVVWQQRANTYVCAIRGGDGWWSCSWWFWTSC